MSKDPANSKVLVIEDDPDQVLLYKVEFEAQGFTIDTAMGGEEGLKKAQELKPDVILLDIHMEDKSGLDVLRELKEAEDTKDIPVIVFTNFSKSAFEETATGLGAVKFIVKMNRLPRETVKDVQEVLGQEATDVKPSKPLRVENILMVEDNPYHREMYTTKFFHSGFKLITVANGEKALEETTKRDMDVILLDLALPGISGLEVLKKLKTDEKTKDVPVIAFTVTPKEDLPSAASDYIETNTVAYFEKMTQLPNEAVELVEKVLAADSPK